MIRRIFNSPFLFGVKKIRSYLQFRGGSTKDVPVDEQVNDILNNPMNDDEFFQSIADSIEIERPKPRRLTDREVRALMASKQHLTKEQRLLKSVLVETFIDQAMSSRNFDSVKEMYTFRRKYKNYLRIKRLIPLGVIAPFTGSELSKMAYAAAVQSKSVSLTLPGLIGYSLPSYLFFHMSYYYVHPKIKPFCQVGKYCLGAPLWITACITDKFMSVAEEKYFGEEIPIDLANTAGTIPGDLGDINEVAELLDHMNEFVKKD